MLTIRHGEMPPLQGWKVSVTDEIVVSKSKDHEDSEWIDEFMYIKKISLCDAEALCSAGSYSS